MGLIQAWHVQPNQIREVLAQLNHEIHEAKSAFGIAVRMQHLVARRAVLDVRLGCAEVRVVVWLLAFDAPAVSRGKAEHVHYLCSSCNPENVLRCQSAMRPGHQWVLSLRHERQHNGPTAVISGTFLPQGQPLT